MPKWMFNKKDRCYPPLEAPPPYFWRATALIWGGLMSTYLRYYHDYLRKRPPLFLTTIVYDYASETTIVYDLSNDHPF